MGFLDGSISTFPNEVDKIREVFDISPNRKADALRFQQLKVKENLTPSEIQELNDLTILLEDFLITPTLFNTFGSAVVALEKFFLEETVGFIEGMKQDVQVEIDKFQHRGTYNLSTQYFQRNTVDYDDGTGTKIYIALQNTLGNEPTNSTFWKLLTIQGQTGRRGQDGVGVIPKGQWNSSTMYSKDEGAYCDGAFFASAIDNNVGNRPLLGQDTPEWLQVSDTAISTTKLRGQRTIGSASSTVNFITGEINVFNKNTDDLEVIVNGMALEEGIDYNINSDNQSITRANGIWNAGTIFYFRTTRWQINNLLFTDGQSIAENTVSKNKLSTDIQEDLGNIGILAELDTDISNALTEESKDINLVNAINYAYTNSKGVTSIPLGNVTQLEALIEDKKVILKWKDPDNIVIEDITFAKWEGTKVIRKVGGYPTSISDGTVVIDSKVRNQYETNGFEDVGLINNTEYFYMLFPYTDTEIITSDAGNRVSASPAPVTMNLGYNVTNFKLQIGDGRITGTWDNPTELDFEGVMVRGGATAPATILDGTLVYQGNLETFLETGLPNGTEKFYTIWCYNDSNQYSAIAISKSDTPAPVTMDWAYGVTNLSSQSRDTQITLTWTNPVQAGFRGVMVRASNTAYPTAITEGVLVYDGAGTTVTETGLANDVPRYYTVWAYNNTTQYSDNANKKQITVSASVPKIYGVKIDINNSNPETAVTYTDDAVGLTPMSGNNGNFQWGSWADKFPFNAIKPCLVKNGVVNYYLNPNDYTKKADGTPADITSGADGDVMVEFPKIYWKFSKDSTHRYIQYSDRPFTGAKCLAHMRGVAEKDKCYISAYLGFETGGKLRSLSGKTPTANKTISAFRTIAQANGVGYDQMAYYQLLMLQVLYTVAFKNLDSQTALGRGYVDGNSTSIATGGTNTKGMFYGETTGKQQMKFCGIEDFYGNFRYWIDGFFCDASRNILIANQNFNDTGSGYTNFGQGATSNLSGYISDIQGGTETGFVIKGTTGSVTTYYSDYGSLNAGYIAHFGTNWDGDSYGGACGLQVNGSAASDGSTLASRVSLCV